MISHIMPNRKRRARFLSLLLSPLIAVGCVGPLRPPERVTPLPKTPPPSSASPLHQDTPLATPAPATPVPTESPVPTPAPPQEIIISFIGDCTLGGDPALGQLEAFARRLDANGGDAGYFFLNALPFTAADDLTIANLEGPLTASETGADKQFAFRGDPSYAQILASGGVEAVTLANNHAMDFGEAGYADTRAALVTAGVAAVDAETPIVYEVKGFKIGVAAGKFPTRERLSILRKDIGALREAGCAVVAVVMHWGEEGAEAPEPAIQEYARAIADAGADIVVGHHPHILQGIERYDGRVIAYSLGNFVFGGNRKPKERETAILQQRYLITQEGLVDGGFRILPFVMTMAEGNDYQPVYLEGEDALRVYDLINRRSGLIERGFAIGEGWQQ